jgi:alkyl sulfatase BDS1-like metallo-beta-lactamase superfamily hydrolase
MTDTPEVTATTRAFHAKILEDLPFEDRSDFEDASRGLIATWDGDQIPRSDGQVSWDIKAHEYVQGDCPETVNPSLWRQAQLNNIHGLFKVCDGLWQVRGYDLANISFVEGNTGWIVIDTGMTADFAAAALKMANDHLGERPVTGLLYTHSHIDHYGGARAIITEEEAAERGVPIIAPYGFLEESVSENVIAAATMRRRAIYMYGLLIPHGPLGHVDTGLGPGHSSGAIGLVAPNDIINETGEERVVDGVRIQFQFTPDAEAPAEMMFYFPEMKALCTSEVVTHILHNVYTPRGAKVRDALGWSKYIHELMRLFPDADVVFASHHWPIWGAEKIYEYLGSQRDLYKYLHDETLRLANHGLTPLEIAEEVKLPDSLAKVFWNRDYYGTVNHNVKAIYQLYFGWFDANPASLHALPPEPAAKKYVEFMGGADAVLEKAQVSYDEGDYRWVAQVVNHVVFADPANKAARELLACAHTQMGYQAESGPWRDFYLTGAQELRNGSPDAKIRAAAGGVDVLRGVPLDLFFDLIAIRLNGPKAAGKSFALNFIFPDTGQQIRTFIGNGVLNYVMGEVDENAAATLTVSRENWNTLFAGLKSFEDLISEGSMTIDGDKSAATDLFDMLDDFALFFNVIEP